MADPDQAHLKANDASLVNQRDQQPIKLMLKLCGSSCNTVVSGNDDSLVCGLCNKWFHLGCSAFNADVYHLMRKNKCMKDMIWLCQSCKHTGISNEENPTKSLLDMMRDLQIRMSKLESESVKPAPKMQSPLNKGLIGNKISHQVIVTSGENEILTQKTFADKVKGNLRTVPISNIKVVKDGFGVIDFPDKSSRDAGFSKLIDDFKVQVNNRPHRTLLPKITIYGLVTSDYKDSTDASKLKMAISDKNPSLKDLIDKGKTFEILFIKEDYRKSNTSFAVARVDKEIYEEVCSLKHQIYIDFSRCRTSERVHVTQCYRCQKFGHMTDSCQNNDNVQVCRYCTQNHDSKCCSVKGNFGSYKCANCGLNHSSTYTKCAILQKQALAVINRTQGMELYSKNDLRPKVIFT